MKPKSKPQLSEKEQRARRVLDVAMNVLAITDDALGKRLGVTRQQVQSRRTGSVRMRLEDVDVYAAALEINPLVFSLGVEEAVKFIVDNYSDLLVRTYTCFAAHAA